MVVVAGCASVGEPSERKTLTPAAIADLTAEQSGSNVALTFTLPTQSADHRALPRTPSVQIYRAIHSEPAAGAPRPAPPALLVTIPGAMVASYVAQGRFHYADALTAGDFLPHQQTVASYIVRTAIAPQKESAESNPADVRIVPAPQPIADLQGRATQSAIVLNWTPPATTLTGDAAVITGYRIYRADVPTPSAPPGSAATVPDAANSPKISSPLVQIGESDSAEYRDSDAQFGKTYAYSVRSVVTAPDKPLESADSNFAIITLHDVFPPSVPTQLIVTPVPAEQGTQAHLDLSWAINPETDLAGYNVYRSEGVGGSETKLNPQLLPTPAFRDMNAQPGRSYTYTATAVDRTGNESAHSAPVTASLPAESQATP